KIPDLRITADFSHWCCVSESLLEDQTESIDLAIKRAIYIHGRVGYPQGPQVPDFRGEGFTDELSKHEEWWINICENSLSNEEEVIFNPEVGPKPYMPQLPFTNQPVNNLWDLSFAMSKHFQDLYKSKFNKRIK